MLIACHRAQQRCQFKFWHSEVPTISFWKSRKTTVGNRNSVNIYLTCTFNLSRCSPFWLSLEVLSVETVICWLYRTPGSRHASNCCHSPVLQLYNVRPETERLFSLWSNVVNWRVLYIQTEVKNWLLTHFSAPVTVSPRRRFGVYYILNYTFCLPVYKADIRMKTTHEMPSNTSSHYVYNIILQAQNLFYWTTVLQIIRYIQSWLAQHLIRFLLMCLW